MELRSKPFLVALYHFVLEKYPDLADDIRNVRLKGNVWTKLLGAAGIRRLELDCEFYEDYNWAWSGRSPLQRAVAFSDVYRVQTLLTEESDLYLGPLAVDKAGKVIHQGKAVLWRDCAGETALALAERMYLNAEPESPAAD